MAVVFVTKLENGNKINEGLCIQCAKELGVPVDNMLGNVMNQLGITPEQLENMEKDINDYIGEMGDNLPVPDDDSEDGGAPAIDIPKLFKDVGFPAPKEQENGAKSSDAKGKKPEKGKQYKYLNTYCRNLTKRAADGKLDRIIGRDRELERVIQILCRRRARRG